MAFREILGKTVVPSASTVKLGLRTVPAPAYDVILQQALELANPPSRLLRAGTQFAIEILVIANGVKQSGVLYRAYK